MTAFFLIRGFCARVVPANAGPVLYSGRLGEIARQATRMSDDVCFIFRVLAAVVGLVTSLGAALISFSRPITEAPA